MDFNKWTQYDNMQNIVELETGKGSDVDQLGSKLQTGIYVADIPLEVTISKLKAAIFIDNGRIPSLIIKKTLHQTSSVGQ